MGTVKLRNINPLGHVDLALIRREGLVNDEPGTGCLLPGEVFEISEELAGVAPHWRPVSDEDIDPTTGEVYRWLEQRTTPGESDDAAPGVEVRDPGHGLLAQVGNYELAAASDGLEKKTIADLKQYAEDHHIDLGSATSKADILDTIRKG